MLLVLLFFFAPLVIGSCPKGSMEMLLSFFFPSSFAPLIRNVLAVGQMLWLH